MLLDVVFDRGIQPEYRGDLPPHDQRSGPTCQFGDLDGAGRTHRRRLGGRSIRRAAHLRGHPGRMRTRLDRLGFHHQLRIIVRRARHRRHCRCVVRGRHPARGAMVRLARDGHGRRPLCRHRQCRRRRRRVAAAAHLRHRLPERVSVARRDRALGRRLVSGARQRRQNHRAARCGTARRRSARHGVRLDPLHRHRPDAGLCDVIRSGNRAQRLAAGLFRPRLSR